MPALRKKPLAIVAAAVIVLVTAVGAYAYWTTSGTGGGTAATGTGASLTAVQTSTTSGLGPGVAPQTLSGNFTNTTGGPRYVGSVAVAVTGTDKTGCAASEYAIAGSPMTVNTQVAAGTAQGAWSGATIQFVNNPAANQDVCQGATAILAYTISATP